MRIGIFEQPLSDINCIDYLNDVGNGDRVYIIKRGIRIKVNNLILDGDGQSVCQ